MGERISEHRNVTLDAMKEVAAESSQELRNEQQESAGAFLSQVEDMVNPYAAAIKKNDIKTHKTRLEKMMKPGSNNPRIIPVTQIQDSAKQFQGKNPELGWEKLAALKQSIKEGDTKEIILSKIRVMFPDILNAADAFDFLLSFEKDVESDFKDQLLEAKAEFLEQNDREIKAGRNITTIARQAASKGLGTPSSLREMYQDITGNPRDSGTLFEQLSQKYAFKDLKKVIDFLLHSLGADMKSKGPSIEPGQLHRLFTEVKSLQAILGVYRFFNGRMRLLISQFKQQGIPIPQQLSFESMAKQFMGLCAERYPSADKVKQSAIRLGIDKWIGAKISTFSQFRDGVREVAINQIYRSYQHRDDLYLSILEALEDLEDQWEELQDEKEDKSEDEEMHKEEKSSVAPGTNQKKIA
jgi:type III secretion protein W